MTTGDGPEGGNVRDPGAGDPGVGLPSGKVSDGRERIFGTRTTGTMAAVIASASGTAPPADPKGLHGFLGCPVSPRMRVRRSTVLMVVLFLGLGTLSLMFPPLDTSGTTSRTPATQAPAPTVAPATTTTTTAPSGSTTTTTRATPGSTTTTIPTTRVAPATTTTTTAPSGSTTTTTRATAGSTTTTAPGVSSPSTTTTAPAGSGAGGAS